MFVLLILQFPPVQTKLGEYGTVWLSKKIGYPVSIERISIDWFDEINLRGVSIRDPRKKPLIEVNELIINYRFHTLLNDNEDIYLEKVVINGAIITLVQEGDSLNIDGFINAIDRLTTSSDTTRHPTAESSFQIARAIVRNTRFSYTDSAFMYSEPPDIFNPSHFAFNYINADVSNFIIVADTVQLEVSGLKASEERSKLHIKELSSFVRYCRKGLDFYGLVANVGNSLLKDTLELRYNHPSDFVHFNQKIKLRACLKQSVIDMADLAKFNPEMAAYQDIGKISAKVTGTVDNIQLKDTHLVFGTGSTLKGNLHFVGLPDIDKLWMHLDLYQTILKSEDILQYVPVSAQETIAHLRTTLVKAKLIGYPNNLSIKGDFQTALGFVRTNITLKSHKEEYNGFVETRDFDIGKLSGTSTLGKLTVLGNFQGKGFSLDNANLMAHADVKKLGLMGYDYTNISLDSSYLEKKRFKGSLDINDPNIKLSLKGNINFEDSTFRFTAKIDTAQLHRLNITDDSIAFSTTIKADFEGLIPDQIVGKLLVKDSRLIYKGKSFVLNLLNINTYRDPQRINRKLIVESDLLNMKLDGKFEFVQLAKDIRMLSKEFLLDVWESDSLMNAYYAEKIKSVEKALAEGLIKPDSLREDQDYKLTFDVKVHNINKLFKF
ncbi:MAG: hypothetical protein NZ521_06215, partial [Flammeovirgaceae bacterium]|nr:hypothetical protein [Flammeovirgaceae bacterium]MDW8287830.1 hypothetical protein [Flammeovirgaceae bacterium]